MTKLEFASLKNGDLVRCISFAQGYTGHFEEGDVLEVLKVAKESPYDSQGGLYLNSVGRKCDNSHATHACGAYFSYLNFEMAEKEVTLTPEELNSAVSISDFTLEDFIK